MVSIVTPTTVTRQAIQQAIAADVESVWMQQGAKDNQACRAAREAELHVVDDGICILVLLTRENRD